MAETQKITIKPGTVLSVADGGTGQCNVQIIVRDSDGVEYDLGNTSWPSKDEALAGLQQRAQELWNARPQPKAEPVEEVIEEAIDVLDDSGIAVAATPITSKPKPVIVPKEIV